MKLLHTSDWHLGRSLYTKKRYDEFEAFLNWLEKTIKDESVDALLVAGDIFDTNTPSNRAQELYYRFLVKIANSCCRHVVIIAGNHDSPSFLNAPKELLKVLNVHVIGAMGEKIEDEIIVLENNGQSEAIVCAVPYLRDKDIRTVEAGETVEDKNAKLILGLKKHYDDIADVADQKRSELMNTGCLDIPIIGMGHLFTAGGKTVDGDGVRELYVGSLAYINEDAFSKTFDYLALGHLHSAQKVGSSEHIRYSGSPIPMGFGEAGQRKKIILVDFEGKVPVMNEIEIPQFQELVRTSGDLNMILAKIESLITKNSRAWLEVEYTGKEVVGDLSDILTDAAADSEIEILRIKNRRMMDCVISSINDEETLDDLNPSDVFERCLDTFEVPFEERAELMSSYGEILQSFHENDQNAE